MSDDEYVTLIRHGSKTDQGLWEAYTNAGLDPSPAVYNVTEEMIWRAVPQDGIDLSRYGLQGQWVMHLGTEPLSSVVGVPAPIDFYSLPLSDGTQAFDEPHVRAEGEA